MKETSAQISMPSKKGYGCCPLYFEPSSELLIHQIHTTLN